MTRRSMVPALFSLLLLVAGGCASAEDDTAATADVAVTTPADSTTTTPSPAEETTPPEPTNTEPTATEEATPTEDAGATEQEATPTRDATPTEDEATGGATADASEPADEGATVVVSTEESDQFGPMLVDGEGNSLYLFTNDTGQESTCTDACAEAWPAVTGQASVAGDADDSLLGTTERDDGEMQVTYAGHPVYYFAADQAPGDTNGQGVGGVWFLIDPAGDAIEAESSAEGEPADEPTEEEPSSAAVDY